MLLKLLKSWSTRKNKLFSLAVGISISCLLGVDRAGADEPLSPDLVEVSTPVYEPSGSQLHQPLGTYTYTVGWEGIPAATVTFSVEQEGLYYRMVASAKTYSGIDLFYKLRYRAEGIISTVDFSPIRTTIDQQENSKRKFTEITYLDSGEVRTYRRTDDKEPIELQFNPNNFMLEPFSAAFLARSLAWEVGDERKFDTFNGKSRYLITLSCSERTKIKVNGDERDVWVIKPSVQNLTNVQQSSKLREAKIFVTADDKREVLQIKSSVFIGSVYTRLTAFTPSPYGQGAVRVAQNNLVAAAVGSGRGGSEAQSGSGAEQQITIE